MLSSAIGLGTKMRDEQSTKKCFGVTVFNVGFPYIARSNHHPTTKRRRMNNNRKKQQPEEQNTDSECDMVGLGRALSVIVLCLVCVCVFLSVG